MAKVTSKDTITEKKAASAEKAGEAPKEAKASGTKQAKKEVRRMMMGERGPDELPERSRKRLGSDVLFGQSR